MHSCPPDNWRSVGGEWDPGSNISDDGHSFFYHKWYALVTFLVRFRNRYSRDLIAEWLACWTQAHQDLGQIAAAMQSGNSLRQTVHTHYASVHEAAKLVAALLRVARVTAGLAESSGRQWLPRTGISSGTLHSAIVDFSFAFQAYSGCSACTFFTVNITINTAGCGGFDL